MSDQEAQAPHSADGKPGGPVRVPREPARAGRRVVLICGVSMLVAFGAGLVAQALTRLIYAVTNLAFYGRLSLHYASPAGNHLGLFVVAVPIVGGLIVGLMARYGSQAIRGHGIPEAMEQVLFNESRIAPRITFLKPISAAIAIGTGGPFGAEGPIIATGGALGSLVGQLMAITADERKTLLAAGAAAGMAATFGCPVSAVLLAIELLLFEYRPASVVAVALASVTATGVRAAFLGSAPMFPAPTLPQPGASALVAYVILGALVGVASAFVTKAVYFIEDGFERLPVHWMWWPAIGGLAVGLIGYWAPLTMGVGYDNITRILSGKLIGTAVIVLCILKFVSWAIALGSGTSGGTLAPLFTIGGALGSALGSGLVALFPAMGLDVRAAALVGMAGMFAGASRALLASVVFAYETTRQPLELLPILGGCATAFLASRLLMRTSIMTEKIARRGARVGVDYVIDFLDQVLVKDYASRKVISIPADWTIREARRWVADGSGGSTHQGFPVLDAEENLIGVVTRRDLLDPRRHDDDQVRRVVSRLPAVIYEDNSLREAADHMVSENVGRLPVVSRTNPRKVLGMLTRSDLLRAHESRLRGARHSERKIRLGTLTTS